MVKEKLVQIVEQKLQEDIFETYFLVDIEINNNKVIVYLDSEEGVDFGKCKSMSRHLESILDENLWFGEAYTLEVSSPGLDSPLKLERQYIKNVGRKIKVKTIENDKYKGVLEKVEDGVITLTYKDRIKEGKRKKTIQISKEILISEIKEAKISIVFK